MTFPGSVSLQARLVFRPATCLAVRAASHIITISEATRQQLLERFPVKPGNVTAIPLAADPIFRPQEGEAISRIRHQYGLPETYGLYLGTNRPHKNLVRLVEAWSIVVREWTRTSQKPMLVIAGPWEDRYDAPTRRAAQLSMEEDVRFLGPIPEPELPGLLAGAEAFVFPSLVEGFGLPVLEAMACGTPVACAKTSSLPEVASEAAVYFDPENIEDMAAKMLQILTNPELRDDLSQRGMSRAAKFSWRSTAEETVRIYRSLVDRSAD
jgi:alpha-1,3-rhamnosyl/mannosyltransferase